MKSLFSRQSKAGDKHSFATMTRSLTLQTDPINEADLLGKRSLSRDMGAVVYFLGVVRGTEAGTTISGLEYEYFQKMADHQFHLLFDEIEKRWPIETVRVVHRLGTIKVNE